MPCPHDYENVDYCDQCQWGIHGKPEEATMADVTCVPHTPCNRDGHNYQQVAQPSPHPGSYTAQYQPSTIEVFCTKCGDFKAINRVFRETQKVPS